MGQHTAFAFFETRITDLATNTTLGTATRHDFAAQTLYCPETTTRTFLSVIARGCMTLQNASAGLDLDGIRVGIKINAVAFSDVDFTYTLTNTGEQWTVEWKADVTSYFTTNDPGTASFSVQVGIACATGSASNVTMCTARVYATYSFADSATTLLGWAIWPLQAHHAALTPASTFIEIGTTGGTSNAPANQIPKLTGSGGEFENITGLTIRTKHLLIYAGTNTSTNAVTTPTYRFDGGGTTYARAAINPASACSLAYHDVFDIGASGAALSDGAVHSFEVSTDVASRFEGIGAFVVVQYEYTASSDTQYVSCMVPVVSPGGDIPQYGPAVNTAPFPETWSAFLDVQEPHLSGSIQMRQSGFIMYDYTAGNSPDVFVGAKGQTLRGYDHANVVRTSPGLIVHRCDHSSSNWTLVRGVNRLDIQVNQNTNTVTDLFMMAIINYRCGKPTGGAVLKNKTQFFSLINFTTAAVQQVQTPSPPVISETNYQIQAMTALTTPYGNSGVLGDVRHERNAGELGSGEGWASTNLKGGGFSEQGQSWAVGAIEGFRKRPSIDLDVGADLEASRDWLLYQASANLHGAVDLLLTYHSISYTLSGTITPDGAPAPDGADVLLYTDNEIVGGEELYAAAVVAGGAGAYAFTVMSDTQPYRVGYDNAGKYSGRSVVVGTGQDLVWFTSSGGETTPPVITIVSPTEGGTLLRTTPIVAEVTDNVLLRRVFIYAVFPGQLPWEVIHDGESFGPTFTGPVNTRMSISGGYQFNLLRDGGWPASPELRIIPIDASGNQG